ncbi:MAG: UDP-3-O-acyl-N-acetylglucosamine deacetylase [bacterium]|nr:UDP-3-O-acyl-N-acetylglucosamine deacetylase [bacterium]
MKRRQTIASPIEISGIGLHTGKRIRVRLLPAPANTGVVFVRTDAGGVEIPATLEHVGPSFYATVIQSSGVEVSTIEHLMAALYSLLVDDVRVEIDGPEVPILDGSSGPFVERLREAGLRSLDAERRYMTLIRPVTVTHDDKRIAAYPCREYRATYAIDFDHPQLGYQELSVSLWREGEFEAKLAPARTFTFESEVEALRKRGLAQGGSLDNAVVLGEEGILNPGLRFEDECVRHKILDLCGDLSLLGRPLRAHVVAYKAGHDLHSRLARKIHQSTDAWYLAPWSEEAPNLGAAAQA